MCDVRLAKWLPSLSLVFLLSFMVNIRTRSDQAHFFVEVPVLVTYVILYGTRRIPHDARFSHLLAGRNTVKKSCFSSVLTEKGGGLTVEGQHDSFGSLGFPSPLREDARSN